MKKRASQKYTFLLISLVLLLLLTPLFSNSDIVFPISSFFFILVVVGTLKALNVNNVLFLLCTLLACIAFGLIYGEQLNLIFWETKWIELGTTSCYALFIGISLILIFRKIFAEREIHTDTIRGGIAIYLLMGLFWMFLFEIILLLDTNAFFIAEKIPKESGYLLYFSYSSLTTLGYGDITPLNEFAMILSTLEAVAGQVFLTVFIARLVGLHISTKVAPS